MPNNENDETDETNDQVVRIQIALTRSEYDLIAQAAELDGFHANDIDQWMRNVALRKSSTRAQRGGLHSADLRQFNVSDLDAKQVLEQSMCVCGATRDPGGKCDSSCILQY